MIQSRMRQSRITPLHQRRHLCSSLLGLRGCGFFECFIEGVDVTMEMDR